MKNIFLSIITAALLFSACGDDQPKKDKKKPAQVQKKAKVDIPDFNVDSAFYFVKKQVDFGPRVPGTQGHLQCAHWLADKLGSYADTVIVQDFKAFIYSGETRPGKNIIGIFGPEKKKRVLLCAHWDTRPYADQEEDPAFHNTPIDGANDGASGVGVLMEIARNLQKQNADIGIDIIFFDLEDYGEPQGTQARTGNTDTWALGSQYWSRNPHEFNYSAIYGILLDMVGVENAKFPREGTSVYFASDILDKVWKTAQKLGYGNYFTDDQVGGIIDDHLYVNQITGIPTIDIIALDQEGKTSFFEHWHTLEDNIENVDPKTLDVVGTTVMHVIYTED